MTFDPSAKRGSFGKRKPVQAQQMRDLRSEVWSSGAVSSAEAEKLFDMNRTVAPSAEWNDFFIEAICEFLLSQGEPRGYVTEDEASWLLRHINSAGKVGTAAELELLVKLLERAEYAPATLRRFALKAIEETVLTGKGPTRSGRAKKGYIDDSEVALIRRLIFAPAGDGPAIVSKAEAEMLFRLKDATLGKENSSEWKKLFVQGVANHLMGHQNYVPPSPEEELGLEAPYKAEPFRRVISKLGQSVASPREIEESLFGPNEDAASEKFEQEVASNAEVTPVESDWLERLLDGKGGAVRDEYEQALLDFLAEERGRPF
jgi:hypothetical protein